MDCTVLRYDHIVSAHSAETPVKMLLSFNSDLTDLPCAWISVPPLCNTPPDVAYFVWLLLIRLSRRQAYTCHLRVTLPLTNGKGRDALFLSNQRTFCSKTHRQPDPCNSCCFGFTNMLIDWFKNLAAYHDQSEIDTRTNHNSFAHVFTRFLW